MGEFHVEGKDAEAFLQFLVSNNIAKLAVHQAQYNLLCNEQGGLVDDLVIYRRAADRFLVVVNASNTEKDFAHAQKIEKLFRSQHAGAQFTLTNESAHYTQIAIQGRNAVRVLQKITETPLSPLKNYWFAEGHVLGQGNQKIPAILARTGYTGEDGFEVYVPWSDGPAVWRALIEEGQNEGIKACGLGARDTLRLEMKYPLYGNELGEKTNPLEAGLGWVVKLDKGDFFGRDAILQRKERGLQRQLVGLKLLDRGIARHGYTVHSTDGSTALGEITSGTQSPSLKYSIAVAYVATAHAAVGSRLTVDIRGAKIPAEVVPTPFYKRPY
jgi:aminomethyltransferase